MQGKVASAFEWAHASEQDGIYMFLMLATRVLDSSGVA
jgi:hypothetical protein